MTRIKTISLFFLSTFSLLYVATLHAEESFDKIISLPPGFSIAIYADNVPNARSMALSPNNTLFVGSRNAGNVYAVIDNDNDYKADEVITIADNLYMPNGGCLSGWRPLCGRNSPHNQIY